MTHRRAARLEELRNGRRALFRDGRRQIALFLVGDSVHAVDNRCPHEGYPLMQGTVDEEKRLLTCQWHNWKFQLPSGDCVLGEDHVRAYPTRVEDGDVYVDVTDPPSAEIEARILEGLDGAVAERQYGRIAREISRLLVHEIDPLVAVRRAIGACHDKLELGTTHAFAATADWLALYVRSDELEHRVVCLTEAIDHIADDALRQPAFPYADGAERFEGERLLEAIEAEDESRAVRLARGALEDGLGFAGLEPWLARAAFAHYCDFGHAAIYVQKTGELIERLDGGSVPELVLPLVRKLCYATREDLLPDFHRYREVSAEAPPATGADPAPLDGSALSGRNLGELLEWVAARLPIASPRAIHAALLEAGAVNLLRFDERLAVASPRTPSRNVSFLDFTHALTFANAARVLSERHPELWPRALLQMACFVGRNKRFLRAVADAPPPPSHDPETLLARARERVLDHGLSDPIFSSHLLKTLVAVEAERGSVSPEAERHLLAALDRFLSASIKEKHPLRAARQALALVGNDR